MIVDILQNAIRKLSAKHETVPTELRIRISKKADNLRYEILRKSEVLEETNLATALNIQPITAFMVGNKLHKIMDKIAMDYGINDETVNVRIYTKKSDCEPLLYLFDGATPRQELDINEFIN